MPELPEVETVKRGLENVLKGAKISSVTLKRSGLRVPFPPGFAKSLKGRTITSITRRAKYLIFHLDSPQVLIVHLGMSGRFSSYNHSVPLTRHDHVIFTLSDDRVLIYNDARRFGIMTLADSESITENVLFSHLGPEPLEKGFSTAYLKSQLAKRKGPIKPALMDQSLVVGVGNIYACEALFLAGIAPQKPSSEVTDKAGAIINSIRKVLNEAIESGGSSLRDFYQISGETGYFQHHFNVYGRRGKPCYSCGTAIHTIKQAGRTTFFCPTCQK